jgi:putative endonuclease
MADSRSFFVHILRYSSGSFYVGHSEKVEDRVAAHNDGRGAVWTTCRTPVVLAFEDRFATEEDAVRRERQIEKWTRAKKEALIEGNLAPLKALSKSK